LGLLSFNVTAGEFGSASSALAGTALNPTAVKPNVPINAAPAAIFFIFTINLNYRINFSSDPT
jgi:hypothetical protein